AVLSQSLAQVFGGDIVSAIPLLLHRGTRVGEAFGEALDGLGDEILGMFHGGARLIDEAGLHLVPAGPQVGGEVGRQQRKGGGILLLDLGGAAASGDYEIFGGNVLFNLIHLLAPFGKAEWASNSSSKRSR